MAKKSEELKTKLAVVREKIALAKRRETRNGSIDYSSCRWICYDFDQILKEAESDLAKGEYLLAYSIGSLILIHCTKLASYADSSSGCLSDTSHYAQEVIGQVCGAVELSLEEKKNIFEQGLKDAGNKAFVGWEDDAYGLLRSIAMLTTEITISKVYKVLDTLATRISERYHWRSDGAQDKLVRLAALKAAYGMEKAVEFINENLEFDQICQIGVEEAIRDRDFDRAEKLCLEKLSDEEDEEPDLYSEPKIWLYLLSTIYQRTQNLDKQIEIAEKLLFAFDINAYQILKKLMNEKGIWQNQYDHLLERLGKALPYYQYMILLAKEGEVDLLLEQATENPSEIWDFGKYLVKNYPKETYQICINQIIEQVLLAEKRSHYRKICSSIKKLHGFGGIQEAMAMIAQLEEKYPRRKALLEELAGLTQKLTASSKTKK